MNFKRQYRRANSHRSPRDQTYLQAVSNVRQRIAFLGLLTLSLALATGDGVADARTPGISPDGVPQRLVLALDGIPYDVFVELQQRGYFTDFRPAARMVSTFPSLSDVSFAAIGGMEPPDGYQNMRFDSVRNKVVGNTIRSLSGRVHPNIEADSKAHSSLHRIVGYMAAYHVALHDLRDIGQQVLHSRKQTYVAYLEESDAVLHVEGRPGAEKLLLQLDAFLQDLQARVRARTGRELLVDIVSDHGSTMVKGQAVPIEQLLRHCGFRRRDRIAHPYDAAYSLAGIIGSVAITVSKEHAEEAARCLAVANGVDLVAVDRGEAVGILTSDGEAEVRSADTAPEEYVYRVLRGDPLGLLQDRTAIPERRFDQASLFLQTRNAPRPNPLRRLWRAFHGEVKEPGPLLVSLADGYEAGNTGVRALARIRGRVGTHGSMTRLASLGVFASNWRDVADVDAWSANDALFGAGTVTAMRWVLSERTVRTDLPATAPPAHTGR